ncbi:MAG: helix-turn-helix transcriptional regulator [Bacteroidales bacterium]|nr:helix-turn-helix transcriptional regulator [Bacteroidales bacterium]
MKLHLISTRVSLFASMITLGLILMSFNILRSSSSLSQQKVVTSNDSIFSLYYEQHLAYLRIDSSELACSAIDLAIERAEFLGDITLLLHGLEKKAEFEYVTLDFRKAIETDRRRIEISSEVEDTWEEAAANRHILILYDQLNIIDSAIYYCDLEINLNRINKDYKQLCRSYLDMHRFLRWTLGGASENSYILENLLDSTLNAAYNSQDRKLIADILITYGKFLYHTDYDAGLAYINQGIDSARCDEQLLESLAFGLLQRGIVYLDSGQYGLAEAAFQENIDLLRATDFFIKTHVYLQAGRVYYALRQYDKALRYTRIAYQIAQSEGSGDYLGIYSQFAKLYHTANNKDSTIFFLRKQISGLYDKFNKTSAQQIAISGARFQISEHKSRIAALDYQNNQKEMRSSFQQKFILLLSISLLLVFILVIILNKQYRLTKRAYIKIQDKNAQLARQEEQISDLRDQKLKELTSRLEETRSSLDKLMSIEELYLNPDISLTSVAKLLKINSTYLSGLINKTCGCNFTQYINKYRIEKAAIMLDKGKLEKYSIEAISKMVGYKSKSAFYRAFRQQKELTPTEYLSKRIVDK